MKTPLFVKVEDHRLPAATYFGYLGHYAIFTNFSTFEFADFQNGATRYPQLRDVLRDCIVVRRAMSAVPEGANVHAQYQHFITRNSTDTRRMFSKKDIVRSVTMYASKRNHSEAAKAGPDIWGDFIQKCDSVVVKIEALNKKRQQFEKKLKGFLEKMEANNNSPGKELRKSIQALSIDLSTVDRKQVDDMEIMRLGAVHKWEDLNSRLSKRLVKPRCLQSIRPCCIFSFYGTLVRNMLSFDSLEYVKVIWLNFLKFLRYDWENNNSFQLYTIYIEKRSSRLQLEKADKYCSPTYKNLQYLAAAAHLYHGVAALLNENSQTTQAGTGTELLDLERTTSEMIDPEGGETDSAGDLLEETLNSYSAHDRIV